MLFLEYLGSLLKHHTAQAKDRLGIALPERIEFGQFIHQLFADLVRLEPCRQLQARFDEIVSTILSNRLGKVGAESFESFFL